MLWWIGKKFKKKLKKFWDRNQLTFNDLQKI